jgi:hypothetical protein
VDDLTRLDWDPVNELAIRANDGLRQRQYIVTLSNLLVTS